jgi:L-ascorbate metabolism protein UlaG (beta-lactamase superfamily)
MDVSATSIGVLFLHFWSYANMMASILTLPDDTRAAVSTDPSRITYLGHATTLIEVDGLRILTDPLLRQRTVHLRRAMRLEGRNRVSSTDIVLISHMHLDHLDLPSLRQLPPGVRVFGPVGSSQVLRRAGLMNIIELKTGESHAVGSIVIEATPANHDGGRPPFGPRGEAIGFLIHGSSSIYFAGDTDLFDEMSTLTADLDVALLPVWGWGPSLGEGHLDPERAANALSRLQPKLAVPIHWGTLCPIGLKWTRPQFLTRPPLEFARAGNEEAPDVNIRVVKPGCSLAIDRPTT